MKLSDDAWAFLLEGLSEPGPRLPDGRRHYDAVHELLERGFIEFHLTTMRVTPAGRAHFLGRSAKERKAARAK